VFARELDNRHGGRNPQQGHRRERERRPAEPEEEQQPCDAQHQLRAEGDERRDVVLAVIGIPAHDEPGGSELRRVGAGPQRWPTHRVQRNTPVHRDIFASGRMHTSQ
jgi:hypothetical protein